MKDKTLELTINDGRKNKKLYFGNSDSLEEILQFLDPMQIAERRVTNAEKSKNFYDKDKMIADYNMLVQQYAMSNPEKSQKYMTSMKNVISSHYNAEEQMVQK